MKYLWVLLILSCGVSSCESPFAEIEDTVTASAVVCYTPLEAYNYVSLIAAQRRGK